jgi:hypothetical protein
MGSISLLDGWRHGLLATWRDEEINVELHEFAYKSVATVHLSLGVAILNQNVFPLDVTDISQPLSE